MAAMVRYCSLDFSGRSLLRLIAAFRLFKAGALFLAGLGVLRLVDKDVDTQIEHWVTMLGFDADGRLITRATQYATNIPPYRIRQLGIASFAYSALYLTQGIGLWMLKRWAEWFTVAISSLLVPVELWEIYRHPTVIKVLVLLVNLAMIAYLIYYINPEKDRSPGRPLNTE
jgi:uncharacterized membrane protein (DUF2068 family)